MDSGDEQEDFKTWRGVPGTIILINMYNKNIALASHAATCSLVKHYLRLSGSNNVGVCLYGIEDKNTTDTDSKNFTNIIPLTTPNIDEFKRLRDLDLELVIPAKELVLSDILWQCSKMFANFKKQLLTRTVVLLTKLDVPPVESDLNATLNRVVDLVNSNVDLKIINVSDENYDIDPFYKDFLCEANKGDYELPNPIWNIKDIHGMLYKQSNRHLAVVRMGFEIGNEMSIGVGIFNLVTAQGYNSLKYVKVDRETNSLLTSVTKTMKVSVNETDEVTTSEDTKPKQVPLLKSELLHYQTFGGEKVQFTDTEMKMLKNPFGPPMLKLLGFKPASYLCKEKWFLKPVQFLFPNESKIEGSIVAFKALHKACHELNMVAICNLITRVNSRPKMVALSPCSRPLNLDVDLGFDIINLPYVENLRNLPIENEDDIPILSDANKKVMKDIINKVKFDYKADMFENPTKEMEYRAIEAIALDEEYVEPFIDTTKPKPEDFQEIDADLFLELFGPFSLKPEKRSGTSASGTQNKRVKKEQSVVVDEDLLNDRIQSNTVNKYTVPQLRNVLYYKNHPELPALNGLHKKDLVELVYKYCN